MFVCTAQAGAASESTAQFSSVQFGLGRSVVQLQCWGGAAAAGAVRFNSIPALRSAIPSQPTMLQRTHACISLLLVDKQRQQWRASQALASQPQGRLRFMRRTCLSSAILRRLSALRCFLDSLLPSSSPAWVGGRVETSASIHGSVLHPPMYAPHRIIPRLCCQGSTTSKVGCIIEDASYGRTAQTMRTLFVAAAAIA